MTRSGELGRAYNLLAVDDEEINREIMVAQMSDQPYQVLQAKNGYEALELIEKGDIDLVLLDVVMPEMDGFETCRLIREVMKNLTLPIIFVTSLDDRDSRVRGKALGCDDFLTKPFDPIELNTRVRNLLRIKEYHDLLARQKEMVEEELDRTRNQLLHADRLATLGTLAAGIGHELSNILSVQMMTIDLMRMTAEKGLPAREVDLERLSTATQHIATHSRYLLDYGRPGPQLAEKIDLREIINSTIEMLHVAGRIKLMKVETDLPESCVMSEVNRTRIEQVLVNLIGNAADAISGMTNRPKLIRVSLRELGPDRAQCSVQDTGCGIAPDKLATVFNAYYTTKPVGKGTGLGLAVVKNIVESYGGKVTVESTMDVGTTFSFDLPKCQ